MALAKACL